MLLSAQGDRMDSTFAPYQHLYPSKFHLLSPSVMSSEATTEETSAHIRSLLQQSPSCRVKGVLRHLQEHVIKWNPTTQQQTTPSTEDGEGSNKIAVMIYSFSEVNFMISHAGIRMCIILVAMSFLSLVYSWSCMLVISKPWHGFVLFLKPSPQARYRHVSCCTAASIHQLF